MYFPSVLTLVITISKDITRDITRSTIEKTRTENINILFGPLFNLEKDNRYKSSLCIAYAKPENSYLPYISFSYRIILRTSVN